MSFVPTHPGDHKIITTLEDQEIPGSPFIAKVINYCTLTGQGLTRGIVGLRSTFKIYFHDPENEKVYDPTVVLNVNLRFPQRNPHPSIQDNQDGTYTVSFVPIRVMASAQVVETSVNTKNSPSQDYTTNPDDHSSHNKGPAIPLNPSKFINIHLFLKQHPYKISCFAVRI